MLLIPALIAISMDLVFAKKVWADAQRWHTWMRCYGMRWRSRRTSRSATPSLRGRTGSSSDSLGSMSRSWRSVARMPAAPSPGEHTARVAGGDCGGDDGAKLFGALLATVINALPLFLLAYSAFTIDGLAERLIRKACGGRESATIYHLAKHSHFALLPVLLAIYVCTAVHFDPLWVVLPVVLISGSLLRLQSKYYKKHL